MEGELARLFVRFQERGDVAALAEVFDRAAPGLLRLALHLARDPSEAEDLVQATFLAAIEKRASFDRARPLRPWLVGILKNQAGLLRRRERAPDPARLPVRETPAPPDAAARKELDEELRRALDALPEPYRQVLVLRLRYDLAPAEIADVLGRAPGTIRAQLHRGLALLRRALPAGIVPLFLLGVAAERGLAAVRDAVLGRAAALVSPMAAATTVAGGLLMKKTVIALLTLALFATGVTLVARGDRSDVTPDRATPLRATQGAATGPAATSEFEAAGAASAPADDAPTATLRLRTLREEDDVPVPYVLVTLNPQQRGGTTGPPDTVRTDSDGLQTVARVAPGTWLLTTDRQGFASITVPAGAELDVPIRIRRGFDVDGLVTDAEGAPVAGALACLAPSTEIWLREPVVQADADGRFTLHDLWNCTWLSAREPGHAASGTYELQAGPGVRLKVTLVLPGPGGIVAGDVRDPSGAPLAGAPVIVSTRRGTGGGYPRRDASGFTYTDGPVNFRVRTDARGRFALDGLAPGEAIVLVKDGVHAPWQETVLVEAGRTVSVAARLEDGSVLAGTARDTGGAPLSGVQVDVLVATSVVSTWVSAWTKADGAYRIVGLPPGTLEAAARHAGHGAATADVVTRPAAVTQWDPVLTRDAGLRGRLIDERGAPLAGWNVRAANRAHFLGYATSDEEGRFAFPDASEPPFEISVYAAGMRQVFPTMRVRDVAAADGPVVLTVPDSARGEVTFTGRLAPPADSVEVEVEHVAYNESTRYAPPLVDGAFRIGPLPAGGYRLTVHVPGRAGLRLGERAREGTIDLGLLQTVAPGTVRVDLSGASPGRGMVVGFLMGDDGQHLLGFVDGSATSDPLPPGSYVFRLRMAGVTEVCETVTVRANEEARLALELREAAWRRVRVEAPEGVDAVRLVVREESGRTVADETLTRGPDGRFTYAPYVGLGRYAVSATAGTSLRATAAFAVADLTAGDGVELRLAPVR